MLVSSANLAGQPPAVNLVSIQLSFSTADIEQTSFYGSEYIEPEAEFGLAEADVVVLAPATVEPEAETPQPA